MSGRFKKIHPALKHGGYCVTGLLPGENRVAFGKLYRDLRAELHPDVPLEDETVATITRLIWRKQNATTFQLASSAYAVYSHIKKNSIRTPSYTDDPTAADTSKNAAETQAREKLGEYYKLVEMGEDATVYKMIENFEIEERLDGMIDKLLKRLWMLKASKSLSSNASAQRISDSQTAP
jgi:hypothetical protein